MKLKLAGQKQIDNPPLPSQVHERYTEPPPQYQFGQLTPTGNKFLVII